MARYFATVARGLELLAAQELEELGARNVIPAFAGLSFEGDQQLLYRVNLWSRLVFRVLVPIADVACSDAEALYASIQKIDWREYLQPNHSLAVDCTGSNFSLNHTHFTALQVKNAIVDQQRDQGGLRSNVDTLAPDLRINLHIDQSRGTLSLDSSGESLHRRGYRPAVGAAPLKESLAAALLRMAEYRPDIPFLDPLCGSGTLPLEAALMSLDIAPGLFRKRFGFESWEDFDASLWTTLRREARTRRRPSLAAPIFGSDSDLEVLDLALNNAQRCGVEGLIQLQEKDLFAVEAPTDTGILICNPPYGERLGEVEQLVSFYRKLGDVFKQRFKGWTAYILTGNKDLAKQVGLKAAKRMPVWNGTIACTFLKYELY